MNPAQPTLEHKLLTATKPFADKDCECKVCHPTPEAEARELLKDLHCEYDAEKLEAQLTTYNNLPKEVKGE